jgi:hypothetical protein
LLCVHTFWVGDLKTRHCSLITFGTFRLSLLTRCKWRTIVSDRLSLI